MAHPFIKWAGGKTRLIGEIEKVIGNKLDGKKTYIEPFVGSGAVFLSMIEKHDFERIIINDLNSSLIGAYVHIQKYPEALKTELRSLEKRYSDSKDKTKFYYSTREKFNKNCEENKDAVERSAQFIFLNKTGYNGMYRVNSKGLFNIPVGKNNSKKLINYENIDKVSSLLEDVIIENMSYEGVLEKYSGIIDESCFIYMDPPYSTSTGKNFTSYNKQVFGWEDQKKLEQTIGKLDGTGVFVLISNVDEVDVGKLYENEKYEKKPFSRKCTIGGTKDSRKEYGELLISTNFKKDDKCKD